MKQLNTILLATLLCATLSAKAEEHHSHDGSNKIKINYETLDFSNLLKKEDGIRYGVEIDHEDKHQ
jgi:hypothetical protein